MATKGMLKRVHTIRSDELEQLADAYDASKKWWEENVKGKQEEPIFVELRGNDIVKAMSKFRWND